MPFHVCSVWSEGRQSRSFGIHVAHAEDRGVSTCKEVDAGGNERVAAPRVAARFHGVTEREAHRRMPEALDEAYDEVMAVGQETLS